MTRAGKIVCVGLNYVDHAREVELEPGDVIATGTPPGVALGRPDPRYLEPGDEVEVEVEGVGVLRNPVVGG